MPGPQSAAPADVATGPGPWWFRYLLVVAAVVYFFGIARDPLHHLFGTKTTEHERWVNAPIFFTQISGLFPSADEIAQEARLEAWSCDRGEWEPLDPRPYFTIDPEDKESRLQRFAYFYPRSYEGGGFKSEQKELVAVRALDDFIRVHHPDADDGVTGTIGGIRLSKWEQPIPKPGEAPLHYVFDPFAPIPDKQRIIKWYTPEPTRKQRCGTH
jgi:hypothetical protein